MRCALCGCRNTNHAPFSPRHCMVCSCPGFRERLGAQERGGLRWGVAKEIPNEPQPLPPYDVENDSAPMDEVQTHCPLCGAHWSLWFGQLPRRCWSCGQNPRQGRSE